MWGKIAHWTKTLNEKNGNRWPTARERFSQWKYSRLLKCRILSLLPAAAHYSVLIVCGALTEITCRTYGGPNVNLYTRVFVKIRAIPNERLISRYVLFPETREIKVKVHLGPQAGVRDEHALDKSDMHSLLLQCNQCPVIPSFSSTSCVTFPLDQVGSKSRGREGGGSLGGDKMRVFDFNRS